MFGQLFVTEQIYSETGYSFDINLVNFRRNSGDLTVNIGNVEIDVRNGIDHWVLIRRKHLNISSKYITSVEREAIQ